MDAQAALNQLSSCGFKVTTDNETLFIEPAGKLTDEQRQWIRRHKAALLAALSKDDGLISQRHPEAANDAEPIRVNVWTPSGVMMTVTADSPEHAEWLRRMNPPTNAGPVKPGQAG